MKKKIRSMMLLIVMSMIVTSCGSADNDANNKKDDLSDVVMFEKFVELDMMILPVPINDKENLKGLYTNSKELYKSEDGKYFTGPIFEGTNLERYELENDKRYFTALHILNDRLDDGSGNWIDSLKWTREMCENWKPNDKLLDDGIDDFIQYCQKHNIPYLLSGKTESEKYEAEVGPLVFPGAADILLCISPDDFFQYELLPNLSYTITLVDKQVDEKWENFVNNHN